MALKSGNNNDTNGSMAKAIEDAFLENWPGIMGNAAPESNKQMKLLFIAVAQGVVKHLVAHPEAFEISVSYNGEQLQNATVKITGA
ncbi:hypothetical protein IM792_19320 [Mucilaginibacter sp. JRF]|jgi:hypothetical protein|uniref:hypothetical protein n=1 Tax=Mucilaginibacter sp. JRF TaxID=2780088 RepID=UPI00187E94BD|nr:hypothetical protein [Mucilaginibacter sp. JRF]MBE9586608.1 hypothetical protein [Mucilaginibacter sp. JRF]